MGGHSLLMFSRLTFLLNLLKALSASISSRHSLLSSSKLFLTTYIAAEGLVYNSPSPTSRVMMSLMTSSIEVGGERRSHNKFGDGVTTTP